MLIAAAGLAGAGKTTSLEFLAAIGLGVHYYVGGIVRTEVAARGLELTPENERIVREALRTEGGMAALAERASLGIRERVEAGACVLIDAICNIEEARFYRKSFGVELKVLAVETPFDMRAARLSDRQPRPMTSDQLRTRDNYECGQLAIGAVIADADIRVSNSGTEAALKARLRELASALAI